MVSVAVEARANGAVKVVAATVLETKGEAVRGDAVRGDAAKGRATKVGATKVGTAKGEAPKGASTKDVVATTTPLAMVMTTPLVKPSLARARVPTAETAQHSILRRDQKRWS